MLYITPVPPKVDEKARQARNNVIWSEYEYNAIAKLIRNLMRS